MEQWPGTRFAILIVMHLFEAARWAPSTYNGQEWRFLYALTRFNKAGLRADRVRHRDVKLTSFRIGRDWFTPW